MKYAPPAQSYNHIVNLILTIIVCAIGYTLYTYHTPDMPQDRDFSHAQQLAKIGSFDKAITAYNDVLKQEPLCAPAHFNLAQLYAQTKQFHKALTHYKYALTHAPHDQRASYEYLVPLNKGIVQAQLNQTNAAIASFATTLALKPHHARAHAYIGKLYHTQKKYDKALYHYTKATILDDYYIPGLTSLGSDLRTVHNFPQALACFNTALKHKPNDALLCMYTADMLNIIGQTTYNKTKVQKAFNLYNKAIQLDPSQYKAHHNLGIMHLENNDLNSAIKHFKKALTIAPNFAASHTCLAQAYLKQGDFKRGLTEYKWRLHGKYKHNYTHIPAWDGKSNLTNKTILLHSEQGFGDTLQFIRYAHNLKQHGSNIVCIVQKPLVPLARLCPYLDTVLSQDEPLPVVDLQAPIMSLPYLTSTTLSTIPKLIPYLHANNKLKKQWHQHLKSDTNFKIGICWNVIPAHDITGYTGEHTNTIKLATPRRSVPLSAFIPLLRMQGVSVYSLQKRNGLDEINHLPTDATLHTFSSFDEKNGSFMDTAAIMNNLDLVITPDTATAHLAGGLGVPVWIMLQHSREWRWLIDRTDSPWYPTARLFTQPQPRDWQSVITQIQNALEQKMGKKISAPIGADIVQSVS